MSGFAAAGLVTAGLGAYKAINGANQTAKANRLAASNIFTPEEMPYQVGLGTQLAQRNYTNGMPGTQDALNNINRNAASTFYKGQNAATSGGDILDLATRIGMGTNQATNQLAQQGAQYKANALGEYQGALGNEAQWQSKLYNNNTLQPYMRTANLAASMYGAGQQNLYSGLDDIASTATGFAKGRNPGTTDTTQTQGQPISNSPYATPITSNQTPYTPYKMPVGTGWNEF